MFETANVKTDSAITYETFRIIQCELCGSYVELTDKDWSCPKCGNELRISKSKLVFRRYRG